MSKYKSICFAIWINRNCSIGYDHYLYSGTIYYLDTDMDKLYNEYKESDYYKSTFK